MSIIIKCDYCGKIYEDRTSMLQISVWDYGVATKKHGKKIERVDYCKDCWKRIKKLKLSTNPIHAHIEEGVK